MTEPHECSLKHSITATSDSIVHFYFARTLNICFIDINECSTTKGGCSDTCTNFDGGFNCSCNDGFQLMNDKKGCKRTYLRNYRSHR